MLASAMTVMENGSYYNPQKLYYDLWKPMYEGYKMAFGYDDPFRYATRDDDQYAVNRVRINGICTLDDFKKIVKGFMVESFLVEGTQKHDEVFGKSITDPCIGWEDTERLIYSLAEQV